MFPCFSAPLKNILGKVLGLTVVLSLLLFMNAGDAIAAPACNVPNSGDWIIRTSCDLVKDASFRRNVVVKNGATLTVPNGRVLTMNFANSSLRVAGDSRILVAPRGQIRSAQFSTPGGDGHTGGTGGTGGTVKLPDPPRWIELSGGFNLIVDFGRIIDGNPQITLPVRFLPDYLPTQDGDLVIPNNFCGFNIRQADGFFWENQNGQLVRNFPYNNVESVESLGSNEFLGGIKFTGPIGPCAEGNEPWQFYQPLTQTGRDSPIPRLRLTIQMSQGSEIGFLNSNLHPGLEEQILTAAELFSDEAFKKMEEIVKKSLTSSQIDSGYCGIDRYLKKICEEEGSDSPNCLVSEDFVSSC